MAKLGISKFETIEETRRCQTDLINRLRRARIDTCHLAGFADCGLDNCGRSKCAEACWFGTRGRRLDEIPATHRLVKKIGGPICEVRVIRGVWARPAGELKGASILAAQKWVRRALNTLFNPDIVAVGTFKVSLSVEYGSIRWIAEIHQIVVGATKEDLDRIFSKGRPGKDVLNFFRVRPVTNLGRTICDVLRREPQVWRHPRDENEPGSSRPAKRYRAEYYTWALGLSCGERMFRYGCDRYFNSLKKKPQVIPLKLPKRRPYPWWLERHMFGRRPEHTDPSSMTYEPKRKGTLVDPPDDYYKRRESDDEN
jgi:hypothetical protein